MAHKLGTTRLESFLGNQVAYNLALAWGKKGGGVRLLNSIKVLNLFRFNKYLHQLIIS